MENTEPYTAASW